MHGIAVSMEAEGFHICDSTKQARMQKEMSFEGCFAGHDDALERRFGISDSAVPRDID